MLSKILDSVSVIDPSSFLPPHSVFVFSFLTSVLLANASRPAVGLLQPALYSSLYWLSCFTLTVSLRFRVCFLSRVTSLTVFDFFSAGYCSSGAVAVELDKRTPFDQPTLASESFTYDLTEIVTLRLSAGPSCFSCCYCCCYCGGFYYCCSCCCGLLLGCCSLLSQPTTAFMSSVFGLTEMVTFLLSDGCLSGGA